MLVKCSLSFRWVGVSWLVCACDLEEYFDKCTVIGGHVEFPLGDISSFFSVFSQ